MQKFKMLVLTDHTHHTAENSLYPLVQAMEHHPRCAQIDVATRGDELNDFFFKKHIVKALFVNKVDQSFNFHPGGRSYKKQIRREMLRSYDVVWLRMPPPIPTDFLRFLIDTFPNQLFINDPAGIYETGSKQFLLNFPDLCPPMQICTSVKDIMEFSNRFPVVLKPFREYGGKGIVKIDGLNVWEGKTQTSLSDFIIKIKDTNIEYLGVKYLKNVSQGDKRIVVINGQIMGASLRLPPKGSWICNVAMGGSSNNAEVTEEEIKIVERINPLLLAEGIVMYGVDTLVDDNNKRILSEINTTSIGGLPQIARATNQPVLKEATKLMWNYITEKLTKDVLTN